MNRDGLDLKIMMKGNRVSLKVPAGMALGLAAVSASANGLSVVSQDSFAAARGDAFAATADNPSAIYYNPAGITQLDGTQLRAGLYAIYLDPTFQPPAGAANHGTTYDINKHFAAVPQLFLTHTMAVVPLSFGLGIYAPFGGSIGWPDDTGFRAVAEKGTVTYLRFNPVAALKLNDYISVGVGLSANYARVNVEQGLRPLAEPLENFFRFTGDGWAVGGNFGVLVKPIEQLAFGATVRSQTEFNLGGTTTFEQQPFIAQQQLPASADFKFPLNATFGVSYRPTPKWNVEVDANYTDWRSFNTVTIQQRGTPPFPLQQNIPVNFDWQASWIYELGVTRYFENGWHASAGYEYNQSSVPDTYYSPVAADQDRHFFSLGVGRNGKRVDFDVTYQFGFGPSHTVTGSSPSSTPGFSAGQTADGNYAFISQAVLVSVGVHF
jgi:long-chain fatty acid transport protein